jgi:DNA-binding LytR/AlgR family response regulator
MNCILLDDEKPALELLEDNVKQVPYLKIVAACRNPMQALEIIQKHPIDLLFMDIQMPGLNGLELLSTLKNPPMVILVTAYEEHALAGFNLDVVDYLVKPVPFVRFLKAVQKAQELFQVRQSKNETQNPEEDYVFVNANYSFVKVRIRDIIYIEGLKDYVRINLTSGKSITTRLGLKKIEEKFGFGKFIRVHKSYIIALDKIESIQKSQLIVKGQEIPIGDGYRQSIQAYINKRNL